MNHLPSTLCVLLFSTSVFAGCGGSNEAVTPSQEQKDAYAEMMENEAAALEAEEAQITPVDDE